MVDWKIKGSNTYIVNSVPQIERLGYRSYMRIGGGCVCAGRGDMMDVSRATKITG